MVDSVSNTPNSLLRAQQIQNANANKLVAQAVINQSRGNAVTPVKASAVPQSAKTQTPRIAVGTNTVLPRGSLVDKLV